MKETKPFEEKKKVVKQRKQLLT